MTTKRKLGSAPLTFAAMEIKFTKLQIVSKMFAEIQEQFRDKYVEFSEEDAFNINYNVNTEKSTKESRKIQHYLTRDHFSAISVSENSFMYSTSSYSTSEMFKEEFLRCLNLFLSIISSIDVIRVGLRYSDLIKLDHPSEINTVFNDALSVPQSLSGLEGVNSVYQRQETALKTPIGILLTRTHVSHSDLNHMPDAKLPIVLPRDEEPSFRVILDFDHMIQYHDSAKRYNESEFKVLFSDLHKYTSSAFWNLTTDYAKEELWDLQT